MSIIKARVLHRSAGIKSSHVNTNHHALHLWPGLYPTLIKFSLNSCHKMDIRRLQDTVCLLNSRQGERIGSNILLTELELIHRGRKTLLEQRVRLCTRV